MGREVRKVAPDWQHPTDENGDLRPLLREEMPAWTPEQATHLQMYENTTEGTPMSPVMDCPAKLARWLADTGASAFAGRPASYEAWLHVCRGNDAVTAVIDGKTGTVTSGVEAEQPSCRRTITKDEFCDRFTAHMLKHSTETSTGGGSMEDYARAVSATYYDDDYQDNPSLTPEECAAADMSSWEGRRVKAPSWLFALLPGTAMKWAMFCDWVRNTWNGRVSSRRPRRSISQRRTRP